MQHVIQPATAGNTHVHPSEGPPERDDVTAWRGPLGETIERREPAAVAAAMFIALFSTIAAGGAR